MSSAFAGLSTLRKKDEDTAPKPISEKAKQLQAYLAAQYGGDPTGGGNRTTKPKKKKKRPRQKPGYGAVTIVDEDATGFGNDATRLACDHGEEEEDAPVIANADEAEVLRKQAEKERELEASRRYDQGSGWAIVGEGPASELTEVGRDGPADASPPRRRMRHDSSGEDASPPRRRMRHDSSGEDASPPRRRPRHDSSGEDASPPRRRPRHDSSGEDASPPRRRPRHDSSGEDASPPRRPGAEDLSPPRRRTAASPPKAADRPTMADGSLAGKLSGRELMQEMERKRAEETKRFAALAADMTGQHAETVYRDTTGRRVTEKEYAEARATERRGRPKAEYDDEAQLAWGGGLVQRTQREEEERRMREEAAKPFARTYDADYDAERRQKTRWGDPMAHLVSSKIPEEALAAPSVAAEKQDVLKTSGFVIPMDVPAHSWLRRGVGAPPNRYGIKPGRHWDGVDRSNGFERDMFKRQTELKRRELEAAQWAQSDL